MNSGFGFGFGLGALHAKLRMDPKHVEWVLGVSGLRAEKSSRDILEGEGGGLLLTTTTWMRISRKK